MSFSLPSFTRALPAALTLTLALSGALALAQSRPPDIAFTPRALDPGASETAAVGDMNKDGRLDIISGEFWYEAPSWTKHRFRELNYTNGYIDAFSDLAIDVNGDGYSDIVTVSWFAKKMSWWKNPGRTRAAWLEIPIDSGFPIEFAFLVDIDNDGKAREVLPQSGDEKAPLAWYELKGGAGEGAWIKHVVSPRSYGHGIGAGDVNGDGRADILTPKGWLEAPADPRGSAEWTLHADWEEKAHLGFLHVVDINGDKRPDVLTSNGHDYGVFWLEQAADGAAAGKKWTRRVIDDAWSQAHASTLIDLNGDGRLDFVTGKRFMAHNGKDPGEREPLGVYWYEHRAKADAAGGVEWIRHLVDYGSRVGGGMQIPIVDLDGDGDLDLVVGGKSGLFLIQNDAKAPIARR
jgi:FG-GAP-like repeat